MAMRRNVAPSTALFSPRARAYWTPALRGGAITERSNSPSFPARLQSCRGLHTPLKAKRPAASNRCLTGRPHSFPLAGRSSRAPNLDPTVKTGVPSRSLKWSRSRVQPFPGGGSYNLWTIRTQTLASPYSNKEVSRKEYAKLSGANPNDPRLWRGQAANLLTTVSWRSYVVSVICRKHIALAPGNRKIDRRSTWEILGSGLSTKAGWPNRQPSPRVGSSTG